MIERLLEALALKRLDRAGWVRRGVPRPESVAAHSWGVSWLVLVLLPPHLNRERALSYAVLHDLAEVRVGDLTPADGIPARQKAEREDQAMAQMMRGLPAHLLQTWRAYERQDDAEARFVRQLDRLDMALQAVWYEQHEGMQLDEFVASARKVIEDAGLSELMREIERR